MYTIALDRGPLNANEVGTKAKSLEVLLSWGFPVPKGFVVTTAAHRRFLEANSIDFGAESAAQAIERGTFPDDVADAVLNAVQALSPEYRLAVRSSGIFEDMMDASFAGQYDTMLDISFEALLPTVRRCWASAASVHARSYAASRGIPLNSSGMGVIVQSLINATVSGVSFSVHPVTGAECVVINASYGLGESVVSGLVTPDSFEIDKGTQTVTKTLGYKECLVRPARGGGIEVVDTPQGLRGSFSIQDDEIKQIHDMTCRLEALSGFPVDIEWAIEKGRLYCLQMRPITVQGGFRQ